jgi:thiamine biosynthesis lipoprotein
VSFKFSFQALATKWWLEVFDQEHEKILQNLFLEIEIIAKKFELDYSRFLDSSYVSVLNRNKKLLNFPVELLQMLQFAEEMRVKSLNNFNVAVGGILEDLGYDKDYSFRSSKNKSETINTSKSSFISLDDSLIQIKENIRIDLGGLGKGWLIDKIATFFRQNGILFFSINGGGDIYATSNQKQLIEFILENPVDLTQSIGKIKIQNQGLACSASNRRQWLDKSTNRVIHHLINLENQTSETEKIAVFTTAKNGLLADVAATTIFVSKPEQIEKIAQNLEVEFLIIWSDLSFVKSPNYVGELYS